MHTITYVSTAKSPFSEEQLLALLEKSRENNAKFDITGMLLYRSGNFMQAIEGPADAARQLYSNIRRDPTHHNIITLIDEPIAERNFGNWHMGFANLSNSDLSGIEGFYPIFRESLKENQLPIKPSTARMLLFTFRQSVR